MTTHLLHTSHNTLIAKILKPTLLHHDIFKICNQSTTEAAKHNIFIYMVNVWHVRVKLWQMRASETWFTITEVTEATTTSSKCPLWPQLRPRFKIIIPLQLLACPAQEADRPEPWRRMGRSVTPWTHCDKSLSEALVKKNNSVMPQWSWHANHGGTIYGGYALVETSKKKQVFLTNSQDWSQMNNYSWLGRV